MNPSVITCAYCHKHRWCASCNKGNAAEGETCTNCGSAELAPAPMQVSLDPMPEKPPPDFKPHTEWLHKECAGVVIILRSYQGLFFAFHGHAMEPLDRAFKLVTEMHFRGFLDIRILTQRSSAVVIESHTRIILSPQNAKQPPGYQRFPINPDLVKLIHESTAAKSDDVADHDMAAAQKQINETREDLS